jgi:hypothetical protein
MLQLIRRSRPNSGGVERHQRPAQGWVRETIERIVLIEGGRLTFTASIVCEDARAG